MAVTDFKGLESLSPNIQMSQETWSTAIEETRAQEKSFKSIDTNNFNIGLSIQFTFYLCSTHSILLV